MLLIVSSPKRYSIPVNVTLLGNTVFADVIKVICKDFISK